MKRPQRQPRRQATPLEIRDELLRFIQSKFYPADPVNFAKDRPRLLKWVVLKFASYLDDRGVTIPANRYLEIMRDQVLMEAVRFGRTDEIKYRPAWLGKVVELHLDHHGEDYYEEGKSLRNQVDQALAIARSGVQRSDRDPVRDLAQASRLLTGKKRPFKSLKKDQLNLL